MRKKDPINREENLTAEINNIVQQIHDLPTDCRKWNTEQLLMLKKLLSPINNHVTLKATYAFLDWLAMHPELISKAELAKAKLEINSQNANSNGFDVMVPKDSPMIFAEVKCNNPIKGKEGFGSAQITGICKDIDKLMERDKENHKKVRDYHPLDALKFLVLPDTADVRSSTVKLQKKEQNLLLADSVSSFNKDNVYVVFVKF